MEEVSPRTSAVFEAAVEHVNKRSYPSKHRIKLYGLFKHVTVGKCNIKKPMMVQLTATAKYDAWKACEKLSVAEAMQQYFEYLTRIDDTFNPDAVKVESSDQFEAVEELNKLPPPVPPGFGNIGFSPTLPKAFLNDIKVQSGFDPDTDDADDDARINLHEKLVKFYRAVDPNRLVKGIGEIVDYGLTEGEVKLNITLKKKYGVSLGEVEDREKKRISAMKDRMSASKKSLDKESFHNIDKTEVSKLTNRLEAFFTKYDPEKVAVGRETGFVELLKYCDRRGVEALNKKLVGKYGRSLNDVDGVTASNMSLRQHDRTMSSSFALPRTNSKLGFKDLPTDLFQSKTAKKSLNPKDKKSHHSTMKSKDGLGAVNAIELPEYVKPALISFYARYEQERLRDGSVKKVYSWAKRNGLRKLNRELKQRYKQSLDEFVEDSDRLRDDLILFYQKVDEKKISEGLEKILNWGIKNGRVALNHKLTKKYGFDLNTFSSIEDMPATEKSSIEF